jgi:hypothetical protein
VNKGIKRLGIIASVLWVVVGGLWTRSYIINDLGRIATASYRLCLEYPKQYEGVDCSKKFYAEWERDVTNEQSISVMRYLPSARCFWLGCSPMS